MKILHVGVGNLGPGGVATYVRTVVEGQRALGHEVVVSQIWSPPDSFQIVQEKVEDLASFDALRRRVAPDVVHAHSQLPGYDALGPNAVVTAHEHTAHCPSGGRYLEVRRRECTRNHGWLTCFLGHYLDRCGSRSPSNFRWRMHLTKQAGTFNGQWVAPSRYTRDWLVKRGLERDRVHLVHNPGPSATPGRTMPPRPRKVAFLGRLVPNKGVDVLLEAVALVPGIELAVLGDGPELSGLREKSARLGLDGSVRFLGWVGADVVSEELSDTAILAVPSLWPEPFGLVALEAAARGIPVVASNVGGLRDVVESGRTGMLVPPGNPSELARALIHILAHPEEGAEMGSLAVDGCRSRFSIETHLARLDRVYSKATGGPT